MGKTQQDRAVIDLVINGNQAQTSLKEVSLAVSRTRSELNKMKETDAGYRDKLKEMHALVNAQREMTARINDTSTAWGRFKKEAATVMTGVVGGNIATAGLQALAGLIPDTIDKTMKLRDAFANIEKATGMSTEQVRKFNKELKNIDTRTTNAELRDIAVAGGQLGVANSELLEFVKNTDKAVVALGDEFTGGVDQVAKELGGIGKLFKETRDQTIGASINQIGSALNELGAAGAATSPVVAEFTTRMGQLGALAPKLAETLGLGAALQELGLTAEIAASGLSGLMLTAANQSDLFAQHLGMSKKAIEDLIATDPNKFLMTLAQSFRGLSSVQVAQRLKELKVESQESIKVMSLLADQTDFVTQKQQLAARAMADGTSLTDEFSKKNHQLARDLKELKEWFNALLSSESLQSFLINAIHNAVEFIRVLPQIGTWLGQNQQVFYLTAAAVLAYYGATLKATAATVANTVAEGYRKTAYELGFRYLLLQEAASKALALTNGVLTGQITLQTAAVTVARSAWAGLNAIMAANPIGAIVVGLTALAYAVKLYSDNTERALAVEREKIRLQRQLQVLHELQSKVVAQLTEQMQNYNTMSQSERAEYVKNIAVGKLELEGRLARIMARQKEMEMLAAEPSLWQKLWATIRSGGNIALMSTAFTQQAADNMRQVREQFQPGIDQIKTDIAGFDGLLRQVDRVSRSSGTPGGGTLRTITGKEDKKKEADKAREDEKRDAKRDADELEKMLADSRQRIMAGEESDYQKEVAAFAEKYSRMYELAKNQRDKIDEIRRLSLTEFAAIDRNRQEKDLGDTIKAAEAELNLKQKISELDIDRQQTRSQLTPEQAAVDKLQIEKNQLDARRLLYEAHYRELEALYQGDANRLADIQQQRQLTQLDQDQRELQNQTDQEAARRALTDAYIAQARQQTAEEREQSRQRRELADLENQYRSELFGTSVEALRGFFRESAGIQRTMLIAEKAWAIAQIGISLSKQIARINEVAIAIDALTLGTGGSFYAVPQIVKASALAAVQVAAVASKGFSAPAFGAGGFSDGPAGFVDGPTLFTMGQRKFVAGEKGREFIISNRALQSPVVADIARMIDVVQRSGNYGSLTPSAPSGGSVATSLPATAGPATPDMLMVVAAIGRLEARLDAVAQRPISFDFLAFERKQQEVGSIRSETSL